VKLAVIAIAEEGRKTARVLAESLGGCEIFHPQKGELKTLIADIFNNFDGLIFIMAIGIVVRMIAPHLKDKHHDPAVVAVDEAKRFAVSVLSGHEGGANKLSFRVARALMAEPVITTASDTQKRIIVGVGCRRGVTAAAVKSAILQALAENNIPLAYVRLAASVCIKRDEEGLISACSELEIPNPRSKSRFYLLEKAQEILLKHKAADTVVGIVKNAERENEKTVITTLINMLNGESIDMNTTIIVGNSQTITDSQKITGRHFMITPRGYKIPED